MIKMLVPFEKIYTCYVTAINSLVFFKVIDKLIVKFVKRNKNQNSQGNFFLKNTKFRVLTLCDFQTIKITVIKTL